MLQQREEDRATIDRPTTAPQTCTFHMHVPSYESNSLMFDLELKEAELAAYEQAIQLAPREAVLHFHKGQVLERLGRLAEAERAFEDAHRLGYQ